MGEARERLETAWMVAHQLALAVDALEARMREIAREEIEGAPLIEQPAALGFNCRLWKARNWDHSSSDSKAGTSGYPFRSRAAREGGRRHNQAGRSLAKPRGGTMYRQGDVLIMRVGELPEGARRVERDAGRVVLAYGEATGHAHAIVDRSADQWEADGLRYLTTERTAELVHEEHTTVEIPPGVFQVIRQREYDDSEEWRYVAD